MHPIVRYALETHIGAYADWPLHTRLIINGLPAGTTVPGYVIEAQYRTPHGDLLITSFDCPFEESSHFVLLDDAHRVIASTSLQTPYATWLLDAHWPESATRLVLHYHTDVFFLLDVLPPGRWLWRRPRIRLRHCRRWREDPRMRESHARLAAALAALEQTHSQQ